MNKETANYFEARDVIKKADATKTHVLYLKHENFIVRDYCLSKVDHTDRGYVGEIIKKDKL